MLSPGFISFNFPSVHESAPDDVQYVTDCSPLGTGAIQITTTADSLVVYHERGEAVALRWTAMILCSTQNLGQRSQVSSVFHLVPVLSLVYW